jgi:hypothetical protein
VEITALLLLPPLLLPPAAALPSASSQYLCGAILDPETLWQRSTSQGSPLFPERLKQLGIMPGACAA